jgi:hypothetical protein
LVRRRCYKQRLPLVGFRLPAQLARIAAGWRTADAGGFSLILGSRPIPAGERPPAEVRRRPLLQNGEIEDGYFPRLLVKPIEGDRAEIHFAARSSPDPSDQAPDGAAGKPDPTYRYPGRFVDLASLAGVQAGGKRFASINDAWDAFRLPAPIPTPSDPVELVLVQLQQLAALYLQLLGCHRQTPGGTLCTPDQVHSPASYADALLQEVGLDLPRRARPARACARARDGCVLRRRLRHGQPPQPA